MANEIQTLTASAVIKSSVDKFYNFFKYTMTDLVKVFPAVFTGGRVVEGVEGTPGFVIQWSYTLGGISLTANVKAEEIDDVAKSIKFVVVEGDVLQLYKSFSATLSVSEGLAKWDLVYDKATPLAPPPEIYATTAVAACTLVDAYLLLN